MRHGPLNVKTFPVGHPQEVYFNICIKCRLQIDKIGENCVKIVCSLDIGAVFIQVYGAACVSSICRHSTCRTHSQRLLRILMSITDLR
jgi:hypothetical protein